MFSSFSKGYAFEIKKDNTSCFIHLIKNPQQIKAPEFKSVLIESFIDEYKKYLTPNEIDETLTSWYDGENSVKNYYEHYFNLEFEDFSKRKLDYWLEARVENELVGWVTFEREKEDKHSVYMNTLVVHPKHQGKAIGTQLFKSLLHLNIIPDLTTIHLLVRKKSKSAIAFYAKQGFIVDNHYSRHDNLINHELLQSLQWKNPAVNNKKVFVSGLIKNNLFQGNQGKIIVSQKPDQDFMQTI